MKCSFTAIYILAIRVDAVSMKPGNTKRHSAVEVNADSTSAIVDGLAEKNEYMLTVTTITEEYFDNLPEGELFYKIRTLAFFLTFWVNTKGECAQSQRSCQRLINYSSCNHVEFFSVSSHSKYISVFFSLSLSKTAKY